MLRASRGRLLEAPWAARAAQAAGDIATRAQQVVLAEQHMAATPRRSLCGATSGSRHRCARPTRFKRGICGRRCARQGRGKVARQAPSILIDFDTHVVRAAARPSIVTQPRKMPAYRDESTGCANRSAHMVQRAR